MDLGNLISGVKPEENVGGALPSGNYNVMVERVEGKDSAAGGKILNIQLRVFGEKYNNACIFDSINIFVPTSEVATDIGKGRVAKLAEVFGSAETDNWIGKAVTVYAKIIKQDGYADKNAVVAYSIYDNSGTGTAPNANQNTAAQNSTTNQNAANANVTASEVPW